MQSNILEKYPTLKTRLEGGESICIAICSPMYGGMGHVDYFTSLMKTIDLLKSVGISHHFLYTKYESLVQRGRNTLASIALAKQDVTHIFYIDADIKWNENDVLKLLDNSKQVVAGIYPKKSYDFTKINTTDNLYKILDLKNQKHNSEISSDDIIKHNLVSYNLNYTNNFKVENGLLEVRHVATGFLMIERSVFTTFIEKHPEWKYVDDIHEIPLKEEMYAFFDCIIKDNHYLSEDWTFCERWRECGGKIYANLTINLVHTGTIGYEGRIASTLKLN